MKAHLYLILIGISLFPLRMKAQNEGLVAVYDSIYIYDYTGTEWVLDAKKDDFIYEGTNVLEYTYFKFSDNSWVGSQHVSQTFYEDNKLHTRTYSIFNGQQWKNTSRHVYSYHGDNEPDEVAYQWINGQWNEYYTYNHYYDSSDKLVEWLYRKKIGQSPVENYERKIYEYNNQGLLSSVTKYHWDRDDYFWDPSQRHIYTYEESLTKTILLQSHYSFDWEDVEISLYHYTGQSVDSLIIHKINNTAFPDDNLYTYTYDPDNNLTTKSTLIKRNGAWNNVFLDTYEYSNNYLTYHLQQGYSQSGWIWYGHESYTYDSNYLLTGDVRMNMDGPSGDSTLYYFLVVTNTQYPDPAKTGIYPNPTSGIITIDASGDIHNLEIYTLTGERVKAPKPFEKTINLSDLPKGVYILKGLVAGKQFIRKIVKI